VPWRRAYGLLTDADLKREIDRVVRALSSAPPQKREALCRKAELLRKEAAERLRLRACERTEWSADRPPPPAPERKGRFDRV
jgi:hypothetical protein